MSGSGGPALDPAQPAPPGDVHAPAPIPNRPPEPVNVLPTAPPPAELRLGSLVLEPPVTDELLAIPLATRRLVSTSLDLLTRPDAGLRSASFYIGFLMLVTVGPFATLYVAILLGSSIDPIAAEARTPPWWGHLFATGVIAMLGYLAASVEARTLATAVLGGRVEGRPLRLRESIAIARRRFWRVAIVEFVVQFAATIVQLVVLFGLAAARVPIDVVSFPLGVIVGLVIGTPFVYATAGIVLGEVTAFDSLVRSFRLVRARFRLAIVVTLFGVLSQLIVTFGLGSGLDVVARLAVGAGVDESFPVALAVLIAAALVFAVGTLTFLVEAIAAAPAVHAFAALTHYARGLEVGRQAPLGVRHVWDPYVSRPLAIGIAIAVAALLLGLTATPG